MYVHNTTGWYVCVGSWVDVWIKGLDFWGQVGWYHVSRIKEQGSYLGILCIYIYNIYIYIHSYMGIKYVMGVLWGHQITNSFGAYQIRFQPSVPWSWTTIHHGCNPLPDVSDAKSFPHFQSRNWTDTGKYSNCQTSWLLITHQSHNPIPSNHI